MVAKFAGLSFVALVLVPFAAGAGGGETTAAATLQLNGVLQIESARGTPCPPGTPSSFTCPGRTGSGLVRGVGAVTEAYTYLGDSAHPSCIGGIKILGYPVRWTVAGKGEIHFAVHEHAGCLSDAVAFTADQTFTITGGTGVYAGASGSGTAVRALGRTDTGATGRETWTGTLTVPGLEFDVTPPTISGARSKTVRVRRGVKRVRVSFAVTASDNVDASVAVACRPASGSRFKLGRTAVRCTATDSSANTATRSFTVTVRRK